MPSLETVKTYHLTLSEQELDMLGTLLCLGVDSHTLDKLGLQELAQLLSVSGHVYDAAVYDHFTPATLTKLGGEYFK